MRRSRSRSFASFLNLCLCFCGFPQICWSTRETFYVCKDAWKYSVFSETCIKKFEKKLDWVSARGVCHHLQGDLVIIKNNAMNEYVHDYIQPSKEAFFTGLNDLKFNGDFRWLDLDGEANFIKFLDGNRNGKRTHHCSVINSQLARAQRAWIDYDCGVPTKYICERDQDLAKMCAVGWTNNNASGTCIKRFLEGATWQEANNTCRRHGADLLIIFNEDINELLSSFLTLIDSSYWIGLNDIHAEGKYRWIDYMDEVDYVKSAFRGQPQVGQAQCMSVQNPDKGWERKSCDTKQPFICEKFAEHCSNFPRAACPKSCSSCQGDVCNRRTGVCSLGCYSGYRGLKCTAKTSIEILETEKSSSCSKAYLVIDKDYQLVKFNISWDDLHYSIDKSDSPTVVNFTSGESLCPLIGQDNNCTLTTFQNYSCLCEEITLGEYHLTFNHTPNQPGDNFTLYMRWLEYNGGSHITSKKHTLLEVRYHCGQSKPLGQISLWDLSSKFVTKAVFALGVVLVGAALTGAGAFLSTMGEPAQVQGKVVDLKEAVPIGIYSTRDDDDSESQTSPGHKSYTSFKEEDRLSISSEVDKRSAQGDIKPQ